MFLLMLRTLSQLKFPKRAVAVDVGSLFDIKDLVNCYGCVSHSMLFATVMIPRYWDNANVDQWKLKLHSHKRGGLASGLR